MICHRNAHQQLFAAFLCVICEHLAELPSANLDRHPKKKNIWHFCSNWTNVVCYVALLVDIINLFYEISKTLQRTAMPTMHTHSITQLFLNNSNDGVGVTCTFLKAEGSFFPAWFTSVLWFCRAICQNIDRSFMQSSMRLKTTTHLDVTRFNDLWCPCHNWFCFLSANNFLLQFGHRDSSVVGLKYIGL